LQHSKVLGSDFLQTLQYRRAILLAVLEASSNSLFVIELYYVAIGCLAAEAMAMFMASGKESCSSSRDCNWGEGAYALLEVFGAACGIPDGEEGLLFLVGRCSRDMPRLKQFDVTHISPLTPTLPQAPSTFERSEFLQGRL
jgi:hypothetical protein